MTASVRVRTNHFADFGKTTTRAGAFDDTSVSKHASLAIPLSSNASSWGSNSIWKCAATPAGYGASAKDASTSKDFSLIYKSADKPGNRLVDDASARDMQKGSGSLQPSVGLDPWRRSSYWAPRDTPSFDGPIRRASATAPDEQFSRKHQVDKSSLPTANQLSLPQYTHGLSRQASNRSVTDYPSKHAGDNSVQAFEELGRLHENDGNPRLRERNIGHWAESAVSIPSAAERRSSCFALPSAPSSHQGSLPPSRNGLDVSKYPASQGMPWPSHLQQLSAGENLDVPTGNDSLPPFQAHSGSFTSNFERLKLSGSVNVEGASARQALASHGRHTFTPHVSSRPDQPHRDIHDDLRTRLPTETTCQERKLTAIAKEHSQPFADQYETFREYHSGNAALNHLAVSDARHNHGRGQQSSREHLPLRNTGMPFSSNETQRYLEDYAGQLERRIRWQQDQDPMANPYVQHLMAINARYGHPYAYPLPLDLQENVLPGYLSMARLPPLMLCPPPSDMQSGSGIRSVLMEEFKSNHKGTRRFELREIYEHIAEFASDQHGSRFIQQKLEMANSDEKERVFRELLPNSAQLMIDVFGNYVIQKFFDHGDQNQKKILTNRMKGQILHLSLNTYGCRVVQKAFDHVFIDQQASMVKELEGHVLKCVRDQNGNHVIQKAIERVPTHHVQFIIDAFIGQVQHLATHPYGCRVVQRLLERCEEPAHSMILKELHDCATTLIVDQYGNYVTQHVIVHGSPEDRAKIIGIVRNNLVAFSKQKFASNVVEKSIIFGTDLQRREIMLQLTARNAYGECALPCLIKDAYGNYVIQRLLDSLNPTDYAAFIEVLYPEVAKAKRQLPNKQAENVAKRMHRFDGLAGFHGHPSSTNLPFLNTNDSTVATPPLTNDSGHSPVSTSVMSTADEFSAKYVATGLKPKEPPVTIEIYQS